MSQLKIPSLALAGEERQDQVNEWDLIQVFQFLRLYFYSESLCMVDVLHLVFGTSYISQNGSSVKTQMVFHYCQLCYYPISLFFL